MKAETPDAATCEMYQTELSVPERYRVDVPRVDECTWQKLYLAADRDGKSIKADHVRCLPDTATFPVEKIGAPGQYRAYQKVRVGDGVVELAVITVQAGVIHGLLQVDRIAVGRAISTNSLSQFHLRADELNELVQALLNTRLVRIEANRLSGIQGQAFRARCAAWDEPAKGAVTIDAWRGLSGVGN